MAQAIQHLLISDLDDTLIGDPEALAKLAQKAATWAGFAFAYASGRSCASMRQSIEEHGLPAPVALIGSVGTEIQYYPDSGAFGDWPGDRADQWSADGVRAAFANTARLIPQPESEQTDFKVSYHCEDATEEELEHFLQILSEDAIDAGYIYSSNRDLDFLPSGVDKGTAAAHLARALELTENLVMVSGNSSNDASLFNHGFHGIVVGNAHEELKEHGRRRDAYIAEKAYAAGVLEGIEYHLKHGA